jgi:hypothetical protein
MAILTERYEDAGDFFGLRQDYRKRNLERVRREFGLPVPEIVEGRAIYRDADGNEHPWHQSQRREPSVEEIEEFWGGSPAITPLTVAEDGVPISAEGRDLERDLGNLLRSETVTHGVEANPEFRVSDPLNEQAVDRELQEYIKNHDK